MIEETQRKRRGHPFLPSASELEQVPALYATESTPVEDKVLHLHFFAPWGDWYAAEVGVLDSAPLMFGYARLAGGNGEWGYTDLEALERGLKDGLWVVERDLYWEPVTFREAGIER